MLANKRTESYAVIAKKVDMERSGVYRALTNPWRTPLKTYLKLAKALNYPLDIATKEWRESNLTKAKELLFLDDGIYEKSFRNIKPEGMTFEYLAKETGLGKSTVESICYSPELCSWKAICKLLDFLGLDRNEYYNSWKYASFLQKKRAIDRQISL